MHCFDLVFIGLFFVKVPQENIPPEKEREIRAELLRAFEEATGSL